LGAANYNAQKWNDAYVDFSMPFWPSVLWYKQGWIQTKHGHHFLIVRRISAEKSDKRDEALIYYKTIRIRALQKSVVRYGGNL